MNSGKDSACAGGKPLTGVMLKDAMVSSHESARTCPLRAYSKGSLHFGFRVSNSGVKRTGVLLGQYRARPRHAGDVEQISQRAGFDLVAVLDQWRLRNLRRAFLRRDDCAHQQLTDLTR